MILGTTKSPGTIKIMGENAIINYTIRPCVEDDCGVELYQKDKANRYSLIKGNGYEITLVSYSVRAVAVRIRSREERAFSVVVNSEGEVLNSVMAVENRFWYVTPNQPVKGANNGDTEPQIDKSVVQMLALKEDAKEEKGALNFKVLPSEPVYLYIGVGEIQTERTPKLNEIKNGIESRVLSYSLNTAVCQGGGYNDLSRRIPLVYGYKDFNEDMGTPAYFDKGANEDMEICSLVGTLAFDAPYKQIIAYAKGGLNSAINIWTAFSVTRNHEFLKIGYDILKKHNGLDINPEEMEESERADKLLIYDIMERASRIVASNDNVTLTSIVRKLNESTSLSRDMGDTPYECYLYYLYLLRSHRYDEIVTLVEVAVNRFNASKKVLADYLYYFVGLHSYLGINYFSDDLRPALNFGSRGGNLRISNLALWSRKITLNASKEGLDLVVDGYKTISAVGDLYVADYKEEIGGVSFVAVVKEGVTISLSTHPFTNKKESRSAFKVRLEGGNWLVNVKNGAVKVEKA